jgi:uncharacterized protein (TIGR00730 family)
MKSICIYCGSSAGGNVEYQSMARQMGRTLAEQNIALVYGGGSVGLMGITADACLEAGGKVIGIIPQKLMDKEVGHKSLTEMHVVADMHTRKAKMIELSDGFIAMPGAYGTLDEVFEALTWAQLGYHRSPVALLNVAGFYDGLLQFLDKATAEKFLRPMHREMLLVDTEIAPLLDRMRAHEPINADKWLEQVASAHAKSLI